MHLPQGQAARRKGAFVERVLSRLPAGKPTSFTWNAWKHAGRPTQEGFGIMPIPGVDPDKVIAAVMDVDHYVGNVEHVATCRSVADGRFTPPEAVRFYQKVSIPMLGSVHHELVLEDLGDRDGWRVLAWHMHPGTANLNPKQGARSDYNVGAWLLRGDAVGYALSSAPRRDDVGRLKFAALTKGADAGAAQVLQGNIEGMLRWSRR